jgi:hypothetical protein
MDHRLMREPGRELGVRARRADIEQARLDECIGSERRDNCDSDHDADQDVVQLLTVHGGSNAARADSLRLCQAASAWRAARLRS